MRRIFVDLTPVVRESLRTLAPLFRGAEVVALMREVQPPVPSDAETPEHPLIAATPSLPKTATTLEEKLLTVRSEEHTSELQSLMRISYAVFCLKKKKQYTKTRQ